MTKRLDGKYSMTLDEIRQHMVEYRISSKEIAKIIGMNPGSLRGKLSENAFFRDGELDKITDAVKELIKFKSKK